MDGGEGMGEHFNTMKIIQDLSASLKTQKSYFSYLLIDLRGQ